MGNCKISSGHVLQRKCKLLDQLEEPDLPEKEKELLSGFLTDRHAAFSLDEGERGETDLTEMEIDTRDVIPKKQPPRWMPFANREEVARQLRRMA